MAIDRPPKVWSNSNMELISLIADVNKACELIALDDGYELVKSMPVTVHPMQESVHCWIKAPGEQPIQARYSAAQVNRKLARIPTSDTKDADMAIDYKARALKSAATRKANKATKQPPAPTKAAKGKRKFATDVAEALSKPAKAEKKLNPCLCGCGTMVKGQFAQGHDAKLHGIVARAAKAKQRLDAATRKLAAAYITSRWPDEAKEVL